MEQGVYGGCLLCPLYPLLLLPYIYNENVSKKLYTHNLRRKTNDLTDLKETILSEV